MNIIGEDAVIQFLRDLLLVISLLCVVKFYFDRWRIFSLGRKIPGNKCWPILGNTLEYIEKDFDFMKKMNCLNGKYGFSKFWFGTWLNVAICSPEDAEIYCRSPELLERTDHFNSFKPVLGDGLFTASGEKWRKGKRLMEPSFTYTNIVNYFPIIQKNSDKLIEILREKSKTTKYPFHRCMVNCNYDIISEATFNNTIGAQDGNAEVLELVEELMAQMWKRAYSPWYWFDFIYNLSPIGKKFNHNKKKIKNFADYQIDSFKEIYLKEIKNKKDENYGKSLRHKVFLHKLLDDGEWSDKELREHITTMIATGFETTTSAACFAAMMLGIHKDVQERLYQEVSSALKKDFAVEEVRELEYLDRTLKESMRIFPVAPLTFRQAKRDIQFTDYLVPKGTAVAINMFLIHRDPKQWDNPNKFDPDHFLPEKVSKRHKFAYLPFMGGRRKCIAEKFALISLKVILAKLVLNFKIDCDIGMEDIEEEIRDHITLKMRDSYYPVRLTPR